LARVALSSYALLWAGTLLAALLALPFAAELHVLLGLRLAPRRGASIALGITLNNAREAAIPFLFAFALRVRRPWLLMLGDVVVGGCFAGNVALGGLAIGSYGLRPLLDLPHWPIEWAAFAVGLSAWRRARAGKRDLYELALLAVGCAILLCTAALIETYTVPQG
jgi:hypothetical protein